MSFIINNTTILSLSQINDIFTSSNHIADSTKKKLKAVFASMNKKNVLYLNEPERVFAADSGKSPTYSNAVLSLLKLLPQDALIANLQSNYRIKHREITEILKEERETGALTANETKNWIQYSELQNILNFLKSQRDNSLQNYEFYLFLYLEMHLRPLRTEYLTLKLKNYDSDLDNFLDIPNNIIKINNHKAMKAMGSVSLKFSPQVKREILRFLQKFPNDSDFLFLNNDSISFASRFKNFILQKACGKFIGPQIIRKIVITHWFKIRQRSLAVIKKHARECLHSYSEHLVYQRISYFNE